jgi:2'-5' RNA ligase
VARVVDRAVHEALRLTGTAVLRSGKARELPPPGVRYLTTILRVPPEIAAGLEPVLDRLRAVEPQHSYYAPEQLHVTLANLDGLREPLDRVERVVASAQPLRLATRGLGLSPGTALLRVEPLDGEFLRLRRELRALGDPAPGRRAALVRPLHGRIAVANVARFSGAVSGELLDELARLRRLDLGSWTATEVEIVRTDRLLSPEVTRVVARIALH